MVLEVRGLCVEFSTARGPLKALRSVDLDVPAGSVVGVVGESGCGKSTLAGAVIRLLAENTRIRSGTVRFEGQDLLKAPEAAMRAIRGERISMVFQDPMTSLNPVLSIGTQMVDIQYRKARFPGREDRPRGGHAHPGGDPGCGAAHGALSPSVLGRDAPAHRDRDGARKPSPRC